MIKKPRIGVFDSGVGGLSVTNAIKKAIPEAIVTYVDDKKNVPYGLKTKEELLTLTLPILQKLQEKSDLIVIACNTVSTVLVGDLRNELVVPLVAMEPMVKPASEQTKSKIVAVFATPTTLSSTRYKWLKDTYAKDIKVIEPDCSDWSSMIQDDEINREKIDNIIEDVCTQGADIIVLGCTHYHWIENEIKETTGKRALVIQPEQAIIAQVERVLKSLV